jgi:hypothetical protein
METSRSDALTGQSGNARARNNFKNEKNGGKE